MRRDGAERRAAEIQVSVKRRAASTRTRHDAQSIATESLLCYLGEHGASHNAVCRGPMRGTVYSITSVAPHPRGVSGALQYDIHPFYGNYGERAEYD